MAKRPIHKKKLARLRKQLNRQPLTRYIDLIDWLKTRGHAASTKQAKQMLVDGKVRSESHVVGRERVAMQKPLTQAQKLKGDKPPEPELVWVPRPRLRAEFRDQLRVEK